MSIRDRGSKKWSSFILCEHKKLLLELFKEQEQIAKPQLDEQRCAEINNILCAAIAEKKKINLIYYKKHAFYSLTGYIKKCDTISKQLQLYDLEGNCHTIFLADIVSMESAS